MSQMEQQEIMDRVRGMTEDQMRAALMMVPYKLMYEEILYRYERLLDHYTKNAEEVAAMVDILPQ